MESLASCPTELLLGNDMFCRGPNTGRAYTLEARSDTLCSLQVTLCQARNTAASGPQQQRRGGMHSQVNMCARYD